ncbi:MAG: nucleotide exchange factor GrpE [Myxococcales bacterium]|nr:nucleotide exchange factor GrpE [Myxococcales bacterium]MDH3483533.1 nucleotide exchange factor GrpE [Myxococcales bacterium]
MSEHAGEKSDEEESAVREDEDTIYPEEETGEQSETASDTGASDDAQEDNEVEEEQSAVESARAERNRMRDQLLRIAADFDNFRKRSRKEIEEVRRRTIEDTVREVLPIIDNLERASNATAGATDVTAVAEGVQMVLRGFEEVADRLGLKRVKAIGQMFDPTLHDAMQQETTSEHPPGTIVAEVVPGYELGDRLLRPAMVVVAVPPTSTGDQGEGGDGAPKVDGDDPSSE